LASGNGETNDSRAFGVFRGQRSEWGQHRPGGLPRIARMDTDCSIREFRGQTSVASFETESASRPAASATSCKIDPGSKGTSNPTSFSCVPRAKPLLPQLSPVKSIQPSIRSAASATSCKIDPGSIGTSNPTSNPLSSAGCISPQLFVSFVSFVGKTSFASVASCKIDPNPMGTSNAASFPCIQCVPWATLPRSIRGQNLSLAIPSGGLRYEPSA
jgi:hypothetical protein